METQHEENKQKYILLLLNEFSHTSTMTTEHKIDIAKRIHEETQVMEKEIDTLSMKEGIKRILYSEGYSMFSTNSLLHDLICKYERRCPYY